ncbi:dihydrolipoyllysine-residue acetyltransferase [Colwellia sp. KU-HH00111]|uniref:dihydrolipoyllysine-residue acetyltransferase n=1 Tax=Colwellia sp. KU-HH00111 TaxID=3127652 RepID=UPI003106E692
MSIDFILPDIGEGIVECELVEWLVKEGDSIVEDQPIADVMTDKALVQIPAMHSGVIEKLYYKQGEIAKVHAPLFSMNPDSALSASTESNDVVINDSPAQDIPAATSQTQSAVSAQSLDFILPDIGEGIVECELVEWLIKEGDSVVEDQPIADVMTDKALVQIPAMHSGVIDKLYYKQGEIAKVHAPLFSMKTDQAVATVATQSVSDDKATSTTVETKVPDAGNAAKSLVNDPKSVETKQGAVKGKAIASPAVRRVARELNVNISDVVGSGKKGRVYKEDVLAFEQGGSTVADSVQVSTTTSSPSSYVEKIKGIKAVMAKAMVNSVSTIPHFTYCEEIDMTELIKLRLELKEVYAKQDIKLTMMPFFMKAISLALKEFPVINSQVNDDCTELTYFNDHNIGMAVDSKVGLLVPNVKQVQTKSILDLAADITRLTNDARSGRVQGADLKGGTITISNIGAIGGTVATPIINKPEAAIVALGKLQTLPRFNDQGEVEARSIMQVSWSGDHRIIDGGSIARFCNLWKSFLEKPSNMIVHMS